MTDLERHTPIAIVGIGCLFAGAHNPQQFWDNLVDGVDLRTEAGVGAATGTPPIASMRGSFVTEPEPAVHGLRVDAAALDEQGPVVRWPLHVIRQALADASIDENAEVLARTGLILGNYSLPTEQSMRLCLPLLREGVMRGMEQAGLPLSGNDSGPWRPEAPARSLWPSGLPATMIAEALALGGPRFALDAACASAVYGISLARDYLATGAADVVLAGAVCAPDPALLHLFFSTLHALADNGISRPFDAASTGIVTGQGASVLVLKRLADARRDGDRVHAVVEGIGLSNDGAGAHPLVPGVAGQLAAYRQAYEDGGIDPASVDYIECHATGTPVGDPVELTGLCEFFGADGIPLLGSVKGNIGHLLTVAGFTSILKTVLAMRHGTIPATPPPAVPIRPKGVADVAGRLVTANRPWPDSDGRVRRAGVSAFGFGGTNAHLILAASSDTALSDTTARTADPVPDRPRMAVVGAGVRVGAVSGAAALRRVRRSGRPALIDRPQNRWYGLEAVGAAGPSAQAPAGYVDTIEVDVRGYKTLPSELTWANPQHLLLFEAADEALIDAGLAGSATSSGGPARRSRRVAVVVAMEMEPRTHALRAPADVGHHLRSEIARAGIGLGADEVERLVAAAQAGIHGSLSANEVMSYTGNIMAARIASAHNLTGPAFTVSVDATGGALALEVANLLLLDPTVEAVLVGGVDLAAGYENTMVRTVLAGGRRPVLGDGAAAVVLTRATDDSELTIDAVVIGHADEMPTGIETALSAVGFDTDRVGYLELATTAGAAELDALAAVYRSRTDLPNCAVGSAVPLVGDTQQACVLTGVVGAVLALRHRELPPAPSDLRERARTTTTEGFGASALRLLDAPAPWLARQAGERLVAAVHAVDGAAAAHIIVSAAPAAPALEAVHWLGSGAPVLIPLSGDDGAALAQAARQCLDDLDAGAGPADLARVRIAAARAGRYIAVLVASDAAVLRRELGAAIKHLPDRLAAGMDWSTPAGSYCTARPVGTGRVAFVYPGAFTAYPGAGRELFTVFPGLLGEFERDSRAPWSEYKHAALFPSAPHGLDRSAMMRHEGELIESIPTMLAVGTHLAVLSTCLMRDILGISPDGGYGYSLGESSMLFATGVWDAARRDDSVLRTTPLFVDQLRGPKQLVRRRWKLPDTLPDTEVWTTKVLLSGAEAVRAAMSGLDRVYLTHINTPREVVVAGFPDQVRELLRRLGCKSARSPINSVMHCDILDSVHDQCARLSDFPLGATAPDLELLSSFDYDRIAVTDRADIARRIGHTMCRTVDFVRLTETAYERGFRVFVEVGAGATCTRWIGDTLGDRPHVAVSVDQRALSVGQSIGAALARLVSHGVPVDLARLFPAPEPARAVFRARAACGGESLIERVRVRAQAALADVAVPMAASVRAAAAPVVVDVVSKVTGDGIAIEGEPFVFLPARSAIPAAAAAGPSIAVPVESSTATLTALPAASPPAAFAASPIPDVPPATASPVGITAPAVALGIDAARTRVFAPMRRTMIEAHESFLRWQDALLSRSLDDLEARRALPIGGGGADTAARPAADGPVAADPAPDRPVVWDRAQLLEFASGKVSGIFGPDFAEIDTYPRRVRLPAPPYLFVTRVTALDVTPGVYEPCSITTEYDVPVDAWYAVDGLVPSAVTIEAGQGDLLLIGYLGIDRRYRGQRVYRLLDSELVFHAGLPRVGQTLRYDITIDRFVWNGDTLLFFFSYRCYADGVLILELLRASAGFFSPDELDSSSGVVPSGMDRARRQAMRPTWFKPLARTERTSLSSADLDLLARGRPGEVFGAAWDQIRDGCNRSIRIPAAGANEGSTGSVPRLRMISDVTTIDRLGGPRGLGEIDAIAKVDPDDWYFRSHFPGDPVLPGSLLAEGGVQLLQIYAMYLGMHLVFPDAEFQSVPGMRTELKVRGQITPRRCVLRYRVEITELTMLPRPTVIADMTVYDGDKAIMSLRNFGVRVCEKPGTAFRAGIGGIPPFLGRRNQHGEAALINELHLAHAAEGDVAIALGPEFEIYAGRKPCHMPSGDFRFVDRVMRFDGVRGILTPGAAMETEYDCAPEAWYFHENAFAGMPNCVYMESSLQAAALLGCHLGATLATPDEDRSIRNLDGTATVVARIDLRGTTIRQRTVMTFSQIMPGTTLQRFSYELFADGVLFYRGESLFGFHTADALANQTGLDAGEYVAPWLHQRERLSSSDNRMPAARADERRFDRPGLRLADGRLRLVDALEILPTGGRYGNGYLYGRRDIGADDWYFECHFHLDPVMPGSLGVEALIQALHVYAIESGLGAEFADPVFAMPLGVAMTWKYRGQILRTEGPMTFDLHIKEIRRDEDETGSARILVIADANVWKPGMRIYEITDIAVEVHNRREDQR
ncbi:beta-ketoacyl synthase N-terminal-like domain-containing protein [Nocardia sp. NPDC005366]|uniref:beta-ketoacyl synthase N-terminal-like domain-containing protein n=1 Tax=Nocardia sp. NPDC005366 TaxID=3156878 RepID=UPI0033B4A16E